MERYLLSLSATVYILPMGHNTQAWSTQDKCHHIRPRHQHHADYLPYGCGQKFGGTTKAGPDRSLQAYKGYP